MNSFVERLPALLRELADPVTSYTSRELWCRISVQGWDACWPVLKHELESGDSDVKCLVLDVLCEQCDQMGPEYSEGYHGIIERLLSDKDCRTRMAAVLATRQLFIMTQSVKNALRQIACDDKSHISCEAIVTLLEIDPNVAPEISNLLRTSLSWRTSIGCGDCCG